MKRFARSSAHEHLAPVVATGDRVTQRPGQPVEHRGLQQEAANRVGLVPQHLLDQVVDDVAVVAGEAGDEAAGVLASVERQRRQLERRDPPLGPLLEGGDVRRGQIQTGRRGEVRGGFGGGEAQVGGPDLDQLAAHPPAGQRQIGIGPGTDHDVRLGRKMLEEEGHTLVDLVVVDQVVVVEHQPHLTRSGAQLVQQRREDRVGGRRGSREGIQCAADRRPDLPSPARSPRRSRTMWVRCPWRRARATPRNGPSAAASCSHAAISVVLPNPAGAEMSVSRASAPASSRLNEPGASHRSGPQLWYVQLRLQQRTCHALLMPRNFPPMGRARASAIRRWCGRRRSRCR